MKSIKKKIDEIKPQFEKGGKFEKLHSVFDGFYTFLFTPNDTSKCGVHIHDGNDSKRTMIMVVISLLPCLLFGMYNIGYQHSLAVAADMSFVEMFCYGLLKALPQITALSFQGSLNWRN